MRSITPAPSNWYARRSLEWSRSDTLRSLWTPKDLRSEQVSCSAYAILFSTISFSSLFLYSFPILFSWEIRLQCVRMCVHVCAVGHGTGGADARLTRNGDDRRGVALALRRDAHLGRLREPVESGGARKGHIHRRRARLAPRPRAQRHRHRVRSRERRHSRYSFLSSSSRNPHRSIGSLEHYCKIQQSSSSSIVARVYSCNYFSPAASSCVIIFHDSYLNISYHIRLFVCIIRIRAACVRCQTLRNQETSRDHSLSNRTKEGYSRLVSHEFEPVLCNKLASGCAFVPRLRPPGAARLSTAQPKPFWARIFSGSESKWRSLDSTVAYFVAPSFRVQHISSYYVFSVSQDEPPSSCSAHYTCIQTSREYST